MGAAGPWASSTADCQSVASFAVQASQADAHDCLDVGQDEHDRGADGQGEPYRCPAGRTGRRSMAPQVSQRATSSDRRLRDAGTGCRNARKR